MYTGNEKFLLDGEELNTSVLDFWRWAYSELSDNVERGVLAEFIVKAAIAHKGLDTNQGFRWWHPYDLTGPNGLRLEIKSVARNHARGESKDKMVFGIAPTSLYNDYLDSYSLEKARHSDVFIFCIWDMRDPNQDPLNLDDWEFYVLATHVLNERYKEQKSISYKALLSLNPVHCGFADLREAIIKEHSERGPYTYGQASRSSSETAGE